MFQISKPASRIHQTQPGTRKRGLLFGSFGSPVFRGIRGTRLFGSSNGFRELRSFGVSK